MGSKYGWLRMWHDDCANDNSSNADWATVLGLHRWLSDFIKVSLSFEWWLNYKISQTKKAKLGYVDNLRL